MKIGELLVAEQLLGPEQVTAALQAQVLRGGRLGTNLVDLKVISLDLLGKMLGRQHGMPVASTPDFEAADPRLQAQLSAELALRYQVIPLNLTGTPTRVHLASVGLLAMEAQFELESLFGLKLLLSITPELRILYHLEAVYGIERPNRFRRTPPPSSDSSALPPMPQGGSERRRYVRTLDGDPALVSSEALGRIEVKKVKAAVALGDEPPDEEFDFSDPAVGLRALRNANGRDEIGTLLIRTLCQAFDHLDAAMLLIVRDHLALGWKGFTCGGEASLIEAIALPLDRPGVMHGPFQSREAHFGLPDNGGSELDQRLWKHLRCQPPREVGVVPINLLGQVACLFYCQAPAELDPCIRAGVTELVQGAVAAFQRLVRAAER
jgi:hypothetical protein